MKNDDNRAFNTKGAENLIKTAGAVAGKKARKAAAAKLATLIPTSATAGIALVLALLIFVSMITEMLPSAVWNQVTHVNEGWYDEMSADYSVYAVLDKESEIIDAIYEELDEDYNKTISSIKTQCSKSGVSADTTLAMMNLPERRDTEMTTVYGDVSITTQEYEAVLLYSAYSLAVGQMLTGYSDADDVEKMKKEKEKSTKEIIEDIRDRINAYLENEGRNSYYRLSFTEDSNGNPIVYKLKDVEGTEGKYIDAYVQVTPLEDLVEDIFPVSEETMTELYGKGSYDERMTILAEIVKYNLQLLHNLDESLQALSSDTEFSLPIKITGSIENGFITMKFSGGINIEGLKTRIENGKFSLTKKDAGLKMDIPSKANRKSLTFETQYDQSLWTQTLSKGSAQMKLNAKCHNEGGFRKYGNDYLIALGSYYGSNIGKDRYRITMKDSNGKEVKITAMLGDQKADIDTNSTHQYHSKDGSVIEFIMSETSVTAKGRATNLKNLKNSFSEIISIEKIGQEITLKGNYADGKIKITGTCDGVAFTAEGNVADNGKFTAEGIYGTGAGSSSAIAREAIKHVGEQSGATYQNWAGLAEGMPWCAAFVSYCCGKCGFIESGMACKYVACTTGMNWYKKKDHWRSSSEVPKVGDIAFYDKDGNMSTAEHTGIVVAVDGKNITTVEGNTSSGSQFDGTVAKKYYTAGSKRGTMTVIGYGVIK